MQFNMHMKTLQKVASRYAPSRVLSFDIVHVFSALQLVDKNRNKASRRILCKELALGEGSVKTMVKHMKMQGLIETSNRGIKMTSKGKTICCELLSSIAGETILPKCSIALGKFNHAVLVKELGFVIKYGIEQRDAAIKIGAIGASTLIFNDNKFVMPAGKSNQDPLGKEPEVQRMLLEKLRPKQGDVIIIGSTNNNEKMAELAAKNAALLTLCSYDACKGQIGVDHLATRTFS